MNPDLDRIDFELIEHLQKNARLSNKELAAAVDLAASTCMVRIQNLRSRGILLGAHTDVRPEALGIDLQALVAIRLRQHSRAQLKAFWKHLQSFPEVRTVFHVSGGYDFLVHVMVRNSQHLKDLALDAFTSRPEVAHLETSMVFEVAQNPVLPNFNRPGEPPRKRPAGVRPAVARSAVKRKG